MKPRLAMLAGAMLAATATFPVVAASDPYSVEGCEKVFQKIEGLKQTVAASMAEMNAARQEITLLDQRLSALQVQRRQVGCQNYHRVNIATCQGLTQQRMGLMAERDSAKMRETVARDRRIRATSEYERLKWLNSSCQDAQYDRGHSSGPLWPWMTGTFDTTYGTMALSPSGGSYGKDGSIRVTSVNGAVMNGTWSQPNSGRKCANGQYYGRFRWTFTRSGFSGNWSYCDEKLDRAWNGTKTFTKPRGNSFASWMTGTFDTNFGNMTLSPGGGNYGKDGSIRVISIQGPVMEGLWSQSDSGQPCPNGQHYGNFRWVFSETGFSGKWGYCSAAPNKTWTGTRK